MQPYRHSKAVQVPYSFFGEITYHVTGVTSIPYMSTSK